MGARFLTYFSLAQLFRLRLHFTRRATTPGRETVQPEKLQGCAVLMRLNDNAGASPLGLDRHDPIARIFSQPCCDIRHERDDYLCIFNCHSGQQSAESFVPITFGATQQT